MCIPNQFYVSSFYEISIPLYIFIVDNISRHRISNRIKSIPITVILYSVLYYSRMQYPLCRLFINIVVLQIKKSFNFGYHDNIILLNFTPIIIKKNESVTKYWYDQISIETSSYTLSYKFKL